jgi:hypothetical protein
LTVIQDKCDILFSMLEKNKISRRKYVDEINLLYCEIPAPRLSSINRRRDRRSLGEFALQVYDNTKREKFLVAEWCNQWPDRLYVIEDHGISNDGRLIIDTSANKTVSDYVLKNGAEVVRLELKFCPCQWKLTYKKADLLAYLKENASVLTIMGNTGMIGPNGDPDSDKPLTLPDGMKWILMESEDIMLIMDEVPVRPHREVGGKPGYQLFKNMFGSYVQVNDWRKCYARS